LFLLKKVKKKGKTMVHTVLVTGGSGLVGSALKEISENYNNYNFVFLSSADCDLTQVDHVEALFSRLKPNYVIHLAAQVGGLYRNMRSPVEMLECNLQINLNVVRACHTHGVRKLIACLSTCVFPENAVYPLTEKDLNDGAPHPSNASYAYAKRVLDAQCAAYRQQHHSPFMCVVPTNLYGLHDQFDLEDAHVIPALIHRCFLAQKRGEDFTVRGSGNPLRQFVFARDFAERLMFILAEVDPFVTTRAIVAPKEEVTIRAVVDEVVRAVGFTGKVLWDVSFSDGQHVKTADGSLLNSKCVMPWTSLSDGVGATVEWFKAEINAGRLPRGVHSN